MTIYINGRFLMHPCTGVERYAYGMCRTLGQMGADVVVVCPRHGAFNPFYNLDGLRLVRFGIGGSHFWEQCILPLFFVGKQDYVLLSLTGLGSILVRNKVMTIHDLSFLQNPGWFSKSYYWFYRLMTPLAVRTSRQVITVSQFSKHEILRFYPFVDPEHISVVYAATDLQPSERTTEAMPCSERPYLLAVSSLDPRKNISRLIEAFRQVSGCTLKIVGAGYKVFNQPAALATEPNVEFLGRVSDQEILSLYRNAAGYIQPSLYEGFGLPAIEAMTQGCPVLTSDLAVMHEVCADAALYFDPHSVEDIRQKIQHYIDHRDALAPTLIEHGHANLKRFGWRQSASELLQCIDKIK